jgi:hydrogenase expression/formation protein HypC
MCIGVPMKIEQRKDDTGLVTAGGIESRVSLALVPEAQVGDYVIVHAGFAIQTIDQSEAEETYRLLEELARAAEEEEQESS